ncbi:Flp family type IVb pilin [Sphingomonas mali]|jgi:pilus assembly protein Flp/PilA|uniref:Flp family type IVb pilin n=1 Tax=Sphingomonas mali TaxID=40682 RepID=UPI000830C06E|nr:Flp family type IVb pilin [Sphingomonas mali]
MRIVRAFVGNKRGIAAIEYGLVAALIAVAAIVAMRGLGNQLSVTFSNIVANLNAS